MSPGDRSRFIRIGFRVVFECGGGVHYRRRDDFDFRAHEADSAASFAALDASLPPGSRALLVESVYLADARGPA